MRWIREHVATSIAGAAVAVGLAVFVFVWFQPHKLFIDDTVDEDIPVPAAEMQPDEQMAEAMPAADATEFEVLAEGPFRDRSHPTSGTAEVLSLADGSRFLRIEDLDTDNGPDLFVYLSTAGPDASAGDLDADFVDLGKLKGNIGNQNYEIGADVDLERYTTVVIWCRRFSTAFGTAPLA